MVESYSQATRLTGTPQPTAPAAVLNAVRIMYLGAAFSVVHAVIYLVTENATKTAIRDKNPTMSASTLNSVTHAGVIIGAAAGIIGALLFLWIARSCKNGKNWARVTGTVFFFIGILGAVYDVATAEATITAIMNFIGLAIGLVTVVLLWQPSSGRYFNFFRRPQF
jgi:hypothetical protein